MKQVKSCGVVCLRNPEDPEVLLMRHANRYDLPKGHIEEGENESECAVRELNEETGITEADLQWLDDFRFDLSYKARYKRFNFETVQKKLILFAAWVPLDIEITPTEHLSAEWHPLYPPQPIQKNTIDPLFEDLRNWLK